MNETGGTSPDIRSALTYTCRLHTFFIWPHRPTNIRDVPVPIAVDDNDDDDDDDDDGACRERLQNKTFMFPTSVCSTLNPNKIRA